MLQAGLNRLVSGQTAETFGPRAGQDPLHHYMEVVGDKTGSLIATAGRFGAMFAGPSGHRTQMRPPASRSASPSSSPTTCSTSPATPPSRARPRARPAPGRRTLPVLYALRSIEQSGAGQSPADARLHWLLTEGDLTGDALLAEALQLLRAHQALKESRADVLNWARGARDEIDEAARLACPGRLRGPVRLRGEAHGLSVAMGRRPAPQLARGSGSAGPVPVASEMRGEIHAIPAALRGTGRGQAVIYGPHAAPARFRGPPRGRERRCPGVSSR